MPLTRENRHYITVLGPVVTFHDQLMSSCNQGQAVVMVESLRDILPECVPRTTRGDTPAASVVRIRPQEITHGTLVGNFLDAVQSPDVVQSVDTRRQSTVEAENLVVDQSSEGQVVKQISEVFPDVGIAILS